MHCNNDLNYTLFYESIINGGGDSVREHPFNFLKKGGYGFYF